MDALPTTRHSRPQVEKCSPASYGFPEPGRLRNGAFSNEQGDGTSSSSLEGARRRPSQPCLNTCQDWRKRAKKPTENGWFF